MGGLGLASGIASSAVAAKNQADAAAEQRKKEGIIEQQAAEEKALFNKQYYQDITKRTEVQNMMRLLSENQKTADTAAEARAAVTGATPEQKLAAREVNRMSFADAVAQIASNASQMRDQYLRDYQGQRSRYYAQRLGMQDQLANIYANRANQWATAANNAFKAGGGMLANGLGGLGNVDPRSQMPVSPVAPENKAGVTYIDPPKPVQASDVLSKIKLWR